MVPAGMHLIMRVSPVVVAVVAVAALEEMLEMLGEVLLHQAEPQQRLRRLTAYQ